MVNIFHQIRNFLNTNAPGFFILGSADFMRQTGKIHVVYAVLTVIFLGIVVFLLFLEKRLKNLENKTDHEQ
ncbi:MAG: CcmD family protein [Saprospiraceae bacterium]|nr:CcmD family protein [Saprospiraceae bacterium]